MGWFYLFFFFATFFLAFLAAIYFPPHGWNVFRESANLLGLDALVAPYVVGLSRIVKQNLCGAQVSAPPHPHGYPLPGVALIALASPLPSPGQVEMMHARPRIALREFDRSPVI